MQSSVTQNALEFCAYLEARSQIIRAAIGLSVSSCLQNGTGVRRLTSLNPLHTVNWCHPVRKHTACTAR